MQHSCLELEEKEGLREQVAWSMKREEDSGDRDAEKLHRDRRE